MLASTATSVQELVGTMVCLIQLAASRLRVNGTIDAAGTETVVPHESSSAGATDAPASIVPVVDPVPDDEGWVRQSLEWESTVCEMDRW